VLGPLLLEQGLAMILQGAAAASEMLRFQHQNRAANGDGDNAGAGEDPTMESNSCRSRDARKILSHRSVIHFFTLCIALNMIVIGSAWYGMPIEVKDSLNYANIFFVSVFITEITLKIIAYGGKFWKRSWNIVDFVLVIFSSLEFVVMTGVRLLVVVFSLKRCCAALRTDLTDRNGC
jgi:hypothetical protein